MIASATQETLANSNSTQKQDSPPHSKFARTPSTLETDDFNNYIQQEYGAFWGTLKFEDSLSDYSNEVNLICKEALEVLICRRLDHSSTWMTALICIPCDNL